MEKTKIEIPVTGTTPGNQYFTSWQVYFKKKGDDLQRLLLSFLTEEDAEICASKVMNDESVSYAYACQCVVFVYND